MAILKELFTDLKITYKAYNQGITKQNLLIETPWTMVDGDFGFQRLIFKKDGSLYIIKDGEVNESHWELISSMNSLIIQLEGRKVILNEVFADENVLILKKDGIKNEFYAFANQNNLPELNVLEYFDKLKQLEYFHYESTKNSLSDYMYLLAAIIVIVFFIVFVF